MQNLAAELIPERTAAIDRRLCSAFGNDGDLYKQLGVYAQDQLEAEARHIWRQGP